MIQAFTIRFPRSSRGLVITVGVGAVWASRLMQTQGDVNQRRKLTQDQRAILTHRLGARLALFKPVGLVAGFDNVAMVNETVE